MSNRRKGYPFEKETEALAGKYGKRCYKSGGVGSVTGIAALVGDVIWKFPWLRDRITVECKHGYDDKPDQKTFRIYREWFDKHMKQAKAADLLPIWAMKFKGTSENGMSKFVLIPFSTMGEIIKQMDNVYQELQELKNEQTKCNKTKHSG
jgi:hypothetical protein